MVVAEKTYQTWCPIGSDGEKELSESVISEHLCDNDDDDDILKT